MNGLKICRVAQWTERLSLNPLDKVLRGDAGSNPAPAPN